MREARAVGAWHGTLVLTTVLGGLLAPFQVQAEGGEAPVAQQAQAPRLVRFDIPAQDLDAALTRLADQAGIRILFASAELAGKHTAGLSGDYTVSQALTALLSGSGFTWRYSEPGTVLLERAPNDAAIQLDTINVLAAAIPSQAMIDNIPPPYAGGNVASGAAVGILGNRGFMDTPFNQISYTAQLIQDQQARGLADIAANDPSVRNLWSSGGYTVPLMIRGFPVQDYALGGLYGVAPSNDSTPEFIERLEILKGPSVMLFGMAPYGNVGGAVNLVPKRAGNEPLNALTATYASAGQVGGNVDFGRRFGPDQNFGVRFNGVYRNGNTPVDRQTQEIGAAVLGLDFRGERFRASIDYGYQSQTMNSPLRPTLVTAGLTVPTTPGGRANWFQPWTYIWTQDIFGAGHVEYDLSPQWTVFAAAGGRRTTRQSLMGTATVTNPYGNFKDSVNNNWFWNSANTEEAGVRGNVETGLIRHSLSLVGNRLQNDYGSLSPLVSSTVSNLYAPSFVSRPAVPGLNPPKTSSTGLTSLALADVLSAFDDRIQLILGGRYQQVQVSNFSNAGLTTSYYDQNAVTPAVAFVVKPWKMVSIYGNYVEALQAGPTAPTGTTNAGQTFPPVRTRQIEVGGKVDFGKFASTLSLFQIEQPQGVTDPTSLAFSVSGQQRNQGLEWTVFGEPVPGFRPLGGITLINGVQLYTGSATTNGKQATGVPNVQLNLGAEWDAPFLRGLTFSGRMTYTSMQYLDTANTQSIPAWTRFDAGVRYTFDRRDGKPIAIRLNVENVFDANYWAAASSTYGLSNAAPRTILLSVSSAF